MTPCVQMMCGSPVSAPMRKTKPAGMTGCVPASGCALTAFVLMLPIAISPQNNGNRTDGLVSPKLGIVFGPWAETEFYLNGGLGFHSNDARGVNTSIDPKIQGNCRPGCSACSNLRSGSWCAHDLDTRLAEHIGRLVAGYRLRIAVRRRCRHY